MKIFLYLLIVTGIFLSACSKEVEIDIPGYVSEIVVDGTIETERNNNPRLQVSSKEEYAEIMNNLNLSNPKMMDIAVPANLKGLTLDQL